MCRTIETWLAWTPRSGRLRSCYQGPEWVGLVTSIVNCLASTVSCHPVEWLYLFRHELLRCCPDFKPTAASLAPIGLYVPGGWKARLPFPLFILVFRLVLVWKIHSVWFLIILDISLSLCVCLSLSLSLSLHSSSFIFFLALSLHIWHLFCWIVFPSPLPYFYSENENLMCTDSFSVTLQQEVQTAVWLVIHTQELCDMHDCIYFEHT